MERVTGLDAAFLALETATMHMHIAAVLVFEPPETDGDMEPAAVQFERLRQMVEERLHLVPPLRRRVVRIPFGLQHPVWLEDPDFDLDYHVRRAHLPAPGGPAGAHHVRGGRRRAPARPVAPTVGDAHRRRPRLGACGHGGEAAPRRHRRGFGRGGPGHIPRRRADGAVGDPTEPALAARAGAHRG